MELDVRHVTTFRYTAPVRDSVDEVRLQPRTDASQVCLDFRLVTIPASEPRRHTDYFGNAVHTFDIHEPHTVLEITACSRVVTHSAARPPALDTLPDPYAPIAVEEAGELIEYLQPTPRTDFDPAIRDFAAEIRDAGPPPIGSAAWSGAWLTPSTPGSNTSPAPPTSGPSPRRPSRPAAACARTTRTWR